MLYDVEKLRLWVHKVLPLVYDDSLSYYEVLAKTVQKLNEVIQLTSDQNEYLEQWLTNTNSALNEWKQQTGDDIAAWEREVNADIVQWKGELEAQLNTDLQNAITALQNEFDDELETAENAANNAKSYAENAAEYAERAENAAETAAEDAVDAVMPTLRNEFDDVYASITAVGSPLVATLASQMTDTSKVYVYAGSETGMTNGDWYYYNGTDWVSGGVYNAVAIVTDPTLTQSGVPADAKATGDELTDLKSAIDYSITTDVSLYSRYDHQGYSITLNISIGSTVNTTPVSTQGYKYLIYPCKAGDVFTVYGKSGAAPKLWGLTDENYVLLSVFSGSTTITAANAVTVKVSQDGYFISNVNTNASYGLRLKSHYKAATESSVTELASRTAQIESNLDKTINLHNQYSDTGLSISLNNAIGTEVNTTPVSQQGYKYIIYPCKTGDSFTVYGRSGNVPKLWGLTDENYILLSVFTGSTTITEPNAVTVNVTQDGYFIGNVNDNVDYGCTLTTDKDVADISDIDNALADYFPISSYRKPFNFIASDLNEYIHVNYGEFNLFTLNTTAADVYTAYNSLASNSQGYMVGTELGLASDNATTMYSYTLQPLSGNTGMTIYIISGQHGFEKSSVFGIYYFFRELIYNYKNSPSLSYIRNWCKIICIPLMNPWGFNNMSYVNANHVNLNRNWDTPWWSSGDSSSVNYGGAAPADQVETQYAAAIMDANKNNIFWFIDFHTQGSEAIDNFTGIVWHAFGTVINSDNYTKIAVNAAKKHINDLSSRIYLDYPEDCPTYTICGHYNFTAEYSHSARAPVYARINGIQGETMEGFAAYPNGTKYKPTCHQANADVLANWIRSLISAYERCGGYNN